MYIHSENNHPNQQKLYDVYVKGNLVEAPPLPERGETQPGRGAPMIPRTQHLESGLPPLSATPILAPGILTDAQVSLGDGYKSDFSGFRMSEALVEENSPYYPTDQKILREAEDFLGQSQPGEIRAAEETYLQGTQHRLERLDILTADEQQNATAAGLLWQLQDGLLS